jgi:hypothetical protein
MRKSPSYRIFAGCLFILMTAIFLTYSIAISWVLRDGLGPDAIDSQGLVAWQRFLNSVGPMFLVASLIASPFGLAGLWLISPIFLKNSRK